MIMRLCRYPLPLNFKLWTLNYALRASEHTEIQFVDFFDYLFSGDIQTFELVALADQTTIDDVEEEVIEEIDELDFSMF